MTHQVDPGLKALDLQPVESTSLSNYRFQMVTCTHTAWLGDGTIIVLEPRRLAARAAANRMAAILGEQVGETVGYRVRFDAKVRAELQARPWLERT